MHSDSRRTAVIAAIIVGAVLIIDQVIKIEVKTNMRLHEVIDVTDWFKINFIENNGMAYGMTFFNKLVLSVFRLVAISVIGYYLSRVVRKGARMGYVVCLSMVLAGAMGNMIDCMFYGLIFSSSSPAYASYLVPFGSGYAPFLIGQIGFPLWEGTNTYSSVLCSTLPMPVSASVSCCCCCSTARNSPP